MVKQSIPYDYTLKTLPIVKIANIFESTDGEYYPDYKFELLQIKEAANYNSHVKLRIGMFGAAPSLSNLGN